MSKESMNQETINKINNFKAYPDSSQRVPFADWRLMLLHNESIVVDGKTRYFQGINVGSSVLRIKLLPVNWDAEFGTIELDPGSDWISEGTKLVLRKTKTCN